MSMRFFFHILFFWQATAMAAGAAKGLSQKEFNRSFASAHFEMIEESAEDLAKFPGRTPGWARWIIDAIGGFEPDTKPKNYSAGCHPSDLEDSMRGTTSAAYQSTMIQQHFGRCQKDIETGLNSGFRNIAGIMGLHFALHEHPFIQRVNVHLANGVIVPGLLALKGDRKKRPFVVIRPGIFSTVTDFIAERFILMQVFEQGPSNVLVLENSTGTNFILKNDGFSMGGAFEGTQNLQVARLLTDSEEPLSQIVSGLHFIGISLGGHGLFETAALDPLQEGGPRIQSFTALCPVVHFQKTFEGDDSTLSARFVDQWFAMRLAVLKKKNPKLSSDDLKLRSLLKRTEENFSLAKSVDGLIFPADWPKTFYGASEPWPWFQKLKTPFLVISTKHDILVSVHENFDDFVRIAKESADNAGGALLEQGYHCTLPVPYDWNTLSAMINGSVLASETRWKHRQESFVMDIGDTKLEKEKDVVYAIEWPAKVGFLTVRAKNASADGSDLLVNLPLSGFEFEVRDSEVSEPVRRTYERWLSHNLKISLDPSGGHAFLKMIWPKTI